MNKVKTILLLLAFVLTGCMSSPTVGFIDTGAQVIDGNFKYIGKAYDKNEIYTLIKETENIEFEFNLQLYELLDDKSYLETTYNQVQEKPDAMEEELKAKFLSYPFPKAIVEEWEKVK